MDLVSFVCAPDRVRCVRLDWAWESIWHWLPRSGYTVIGRGGGVDDVEVDLVRQLVVRVGDGGVLKFVAARGGDAVEVDGDVVVRLERAAALAVRTQRLCDGDEGVPHDVWRQLL